jgi:prepilin peptidase CpaA
MTAMQIVLSALVLYTALAGVVDYRTGHIPNRLVGVGALLGLGAHFAVHLGLLGRSGQPVSELLGAAGANVLAGLLACSAVPLLLYRVKAMGGGDVKLLASIGVWGGPILGLQIQLYAFVLAAVYAGARLAYRGQLLRLLGNSAALIRNPFLPEARRQQVPEGLLTELRFGPAVFAASALVALARWWSR